MNDNHIAALEVKHAGLDALIVEREKAPGADPAEIATLKRKKLLLKDQIAGFRRQDQMMGKRHARAS